MSFIKQKSQNRRGFTLLEAIVSLTIIGIALVPITALIGQSVEQLLRASESNLRSASMEAALAAIDPVNPLETPTGSLQLGETTMQWESTALVEPNSDVTIGAGLAGFQIGFYEVTVSLLRDQENWFSFTIEKAGYRRIQGDGPFARQ